MTRAIRVLTRNWPLKVAAVVLATVLYGLLVVTQNQRSLNVSVPVFAVNQSPDVVLLSNLDSVTQIKFVAPQDTGRIDSSSFRATVDLANLDANVSPVSVPVRVEPIDDRIQVVEVQPARIRISLDQVATRAVMVVVQRPQAPTKFDVRTPAVSPESVTVKGAATVIRRVDHAVARIQLDPTGLDFDRDVELIPVDATGEEVRPVDIEPSTVRVRVAVLRDRQTRTLPVKPNVTGVPGAGFDIATVGVQPLVVTVEGDADQLTSLRSVDTAPISVNGATSNVTIDTQLALPTGVLPLGTDTIRVTIGIRQVTATRTFTAGIALTGARSDRTYTLSTDRILVILAGSTADLDGLQGRAFDVQAAVGGLEPGRHEVPIEANLPAGLALVSASPATVSVTVALSTASASPVATPAP